MPKKVLTIKLYPSGLNLPSTIGVSEFGYYIGIANSLNIFSINPIFISHIIILPSKSPYFS